MAEGSSITYDWASASESFDDLKEIVGKLNLAEANEAQARYDVINVLISDVLGWQPGQVKVEEHSAGPRRGFVDYILRVGDATIVIEAKKVGAAFPSPTSKRSLKLSGSVLGVGEISEAISQAKEYAQNKDADAICVTNGMCWCFFSARKLDDSSYATLLFPFDISEHPSELFDILGESSVRNGGLGKLLKLEPMKPEDRLISTLHNADGRLNRNSIADHILPALNAALYADALMSDVESLAKCFVPTEGRSKFDSLLGVHLADPKPTTVMPAPRIKTGQKHGPLDRMIGGAVKDHAPPVTLIIGPVGAGKSTYLKHFELVSGQELLKKQKAHWIYVDFEEMGKGGNPREFLYKQLRDYLLAMPASGSTSYTSLVEPAYKEVVDGLARGPLARVANDKTEFNRRVTDYIEADYEKIEPYVDRLFTYLAKQKLCVIVLDNSDLYEDEELETKVFAEGLALSKRLHIHVIVSLRDRTYVRHRNSPTFNAYELRKLWLDPPPFRPVLATRLAYSRKILKGKSAQISFENGMHLSVPDLGVFFEIVQRSILQGTAGEYIESVSDLSIRQGLTLINNFLTSGHIQADRALKSYIEGDTRYYFPFHEVFKGTALSQWKYYKEARADCVNIFDSRTGVKRTRLLRLSLLAHLVAKAQDENTIEVPVSECISLFATCGASAEDVLNVLTALQDNSLIRTVTAESVGTNERVVISRSGGYYLKRLSHTFVYVEQCMVDTAIEDTEAWTKLNNLTQRIEASISIPDRMQLRRQRVGIFMKYLESLEELMLGDLAGAAHLKYLKDISRDVMTEANDAVRRTTYYSS